MPVPFGRLPSAFTSLVEFGQHKREQSFFILEYLKSHSSMNRKRRNINYDCKIIASISVRGESNKSNNHKASWIKIKWPTRIIKRTGVKHCFADWSWREVKSQSSAIKSSEFERHHFMLESSFLSCDVCINVRMFPPFVVTAIAIMVILMCLILCAVFSCIRIPSVSLLISCYCCWWWWR